MRIRHGRKYLSLWQRIVRAAEVRRGIRLTSDDVELLASEDWVVALARLDDEANNV